MGRRGLKPELVCPPVGLDSPPVGLAGSSVATGPSPEGPARAPDAVAPPERHPRFPLVDGARAIAVFAVIGVHVAFAAEATGDSLAGRLLSHLNLGVTIFFVISGFLLYRPFIAHRAGGPAPLSTTSYFWNRFLRIYPAYALVVTVLILLPGVNALTGVAPWKVYGLLQTLPFGDGRYCADPLFGCGLEQTWSLVVEASFYLALPLYFLGSEFLFHRAGRPRWAPLELAILGLLSLISVLLSFDLIGVESPWSNSTVIGYVPWFALGMGMAIVSVMGWRVSVVERWPGLIWAVAIAGYVALALWLPGTPFLFDREDRLVFFLASGLIAAAVLAPAVFGREREAIPHRVLGNPIVAWLGLISYGLFLWHYAVVGELADSALGDSALGLFAATTALTVLLGAASYYLLERRVLRFKRRRTAPKLAE